MFCEKCGAEVLDNDVFCGRCGATVNAGNVNQNATVDQNNGQINPAMVPTYQVPPAQTGNTSGYSNPSSYAKVFVDPDEQLLGSLGNGFVENMLVHRKLKKCNALLSDKRVYLQGTFFSGSGKAMVQQKWEKIVDLEDITGTGFVYSKPFGILFAILSTLIPFLGALICLIIGLTAWDDILAGAAGFAGIDVIAIILNIILYIKSRKTYFQIEYAGGSIRFNAYILGISNVKDFQKQIRRAKDHIKENR